MTLSFEFRGTNRVANALRRLASQMPQVVDTAMGPWSQETRAALKAAGKGIPRNTEKMRWVSEKQRKFVMASIRDGSIQVPYRRTGRMSSSWSARRNSPGVWVIMNSAPYAVYVVGNPQYWMHSSRWYVAEDEIRKKAPELAKKVARALGRAWAAG